MQKKTVPAPPPRLLFLLDPSHHHLPSYNFFVNLFSRVRAKIERKIGPPARQPRCAALRGASNAEFKVPIWRRKTPLIPEGGEEEHNRRRWCGPTLLVFRFPSSFSSPLYLFIFAHISSDLSSLSRFMVSSVDSFELAFPLSFSSSIYFSLASVSVFMGAVYNGRSL